MRTQMNMARKTGTVMQMTTGFEMAMEMGKRLQTK